MSGVDRSVLVLLTGDPVPTVQKQQGDFAAMIRCSAGGEEASEWLWQQQDLRNVDLDEVNADAVIISGSPASVTDELPWMRKAEEQLQRLVKTETPVLGICFGHQLLASALGGKVAVNPRGREMGSVRLTVTKSDDVIGPAGAFSVNATHVDSVVALSPGAQVLAHTEQEPHAALRFTPNVWGVQFHPEIDGWAMAEYFEARKKLLHAEGFDLDTALSVVADTPVGADIVVRFLRYARDASNTR